MLVMVPIVFNQAEAQVSPGFGDPGVTVRFDRSSFYTHHQGNANVVDVTGKVICTISTNAPDGTMVRVNLRLKDEFDFRASKFVEFEKGGNSDQDFSFEYFNTRDLVADTGIVITLESDWEYLSPSEGSGEISPATAGIRIGPYGELAVSRVRPEGPVKLEKGKWRTVEIMIENLGNTENRVFIRVKDNPSNLEVDIFKGMVIVGPFNEFPFTFTIRCIENKEIDDELTMEIRTEVGDNTIKEEHEMKIEMEEEEVQVDISTGALIVMIPLFIILFFGVMVFFWIRLRMMRRKDE
jgi:hypothetical protein